MDLSGVTKEIYMKLDLIGAPLDEMNLDLNFIKFGQTKTMGNC